jgi:hypothetical protein
VQQLLVSKIEPLWWLLAHDICIFAYVRDERYIQLLASSRKKNEIGDVCLSDVAGALHAVYSCGESKISVIPCEQDWGKSGASPAYVWAYQQRLGGVESKNIVHGWGVEPDTYQTNQGSAPSG